MSNVAHAHSEAAAPKNITVAEIAALQQLQREVQEIGRKYRHRNAQLAIMESGLMDRVTKGAVCENTAFSISVVEVPSQNRPKWKEEYISLATEQKLDLPKLLETIEKKYAKTHPELRIEAAAESSSKKKGRRK